MFGHHTKTSLFTILWSRYCKFQLFCFRTPLSFMLCSMKRHRGFLLRMGK